MKSKYTPNARETAQTPEEIKAETLRLAKIRAEARRRNDLYHMFTSIKTNCPDNIGFSISLRVTSNNGADYTDFRQDYKIPDKKSKGKR
mgnify:CR=1 FL=1